jgi:hypothetical protein
MGSEMEILDERMFFTGRSVVGVLLLGMSFVAEYEDGPLPWLPILQPCQKKNFRCS